MTTTEHHTQPWTTLAERCAHHGIEPGAVLVSFDDGETFRVARVTDDGDVVTRDQRTDREYVIAHNELHTFGIHVVGSRGAA